MKKVTDVSEKEKEAIEKLYAFIIKQMKAGSDKSVITQKLVEMGINKSDASHLVETVHTQIVKATKETEFTSSLLLPALLGGVLAAVVGGVIWGLIVIVTNYEIGFMALGIGGLCGFAVLLFSKGKRGLPLQVIAVFSSILGIFVGKYFFFFHYLKETLAKEYGVAVASNLSIFSQEVIQFFLDHIELTLSGFDILWVILAVITAWRIPKGFGIKL
ncbi:MAG: hypothetical protein A2Y65_07955 [Deltaproteobacteria bacterium RBG_13_52_11]|nr:MAG: hypothetical protein A2Y65_07955 [Deltaproteobacteria bacterium RBG_13_52_11]